MLRISLGADRQTHKHRYRRKTDRHTYTRTDKQEINQRDKGTDFNICNVLLDIQLECILVKISMGFAFTIPSPGGVLVFAEISNELTKTWSSGTTEFGV